MRTTLTIDDTLARQLKEEAHRSCKSFKVIVNETLRMGLAHGRNGSRRPPYRLKPVAMGEVVGGYDLDKALQLAAHLEDEEIARKLQQRK